MKIRTAITTAAATLLLTGMNAQAEETRLVGASDSPAAAVCIAAVESETAARQAARELGVFNLDMSNLTCNNMPVSEFVAQYRDTDASSMTSPELVSFSASDQSPATQLCVAAVTSPDRFETIKEQHFSAVTEAELEQKVRCNRKPLETFVRQYGNEELTASL